MKLWSKLFGAHVKADRGAAEMRQQRPSTMPGTPHVSPGIGPRIGADNRFGGPIRPPGGGARGVFAGGPSRTDGMLGAPGGGTGSVTRAALLSSPMPSGDGLNRIARHTANWAPRLSATSDGAQSVAPTQIFVPTAFDHLFAGLSGSQGWVHSPGSVEKTVQRLLSAEEVVLAVSRSFVDPASGASVDDPVGEAVASAVLLAKVTKANGQKVSVLTDDATGKVMQAALDRDGTQGVKVLTLQPQQSGEAATDALTATGRRLVIALGFGNTPEGPAGPQVVLSRYPKVSEILTSGLEQIAYRNKAVPPLGGERVHAPSAGDAGFAVAVRFAMKAGLSGLIPSPEAHLASVRDVEADLKQHPVAASSSIAKDVPRTSSDIVSAAELIRAIATSPVSRDKVGRELMSPFLVVAFDSSSGGIIAAKNTEQTLKAALRRQGADRDVNIVVVTDHKNAPYGSKDKTSEQVQALVVGGLTGSALLRPDAVMMACNTACTAFPQALEEFRSAQDSQVPVINLIETTVDAMKKEGGSHVSVFATDGTVRSNSYQSRLNAAGVENTVVGCENWADLVNQNLHLSEDLKDQAKVQADVDRYVDELMSKAPNTTSVWLCCTHYPGLTRFIEESLKKHPVSQGKNIPVVDPMEKQAEAVAEALKPLTPREMRGPLRDISVVTSDPISSVRPVARELLGKPVNVFTKGLAALEMSGGLRGAKSTEAERASIAMARRYTVGLPADSRDALLQAFVMRNVDRFAVSMGPKKLATDLNTKQHVMLLTGFSVAANMPETDGPPGTAVLAKTLLACGKDVTLVVDKGNEPAMRESIKAIVAQGGKEPKLVVFDPAGKDAAAYAGSILSNSKPDAVVAIELPGRNLSGSYLNMRGASVSEFNAPVDRVLVAAAEQGTYTAGIGDGGNEAGIGNQEGIPKGRYEDREFDFKTVVKSERPVTAWNSNFGAIATAMELAHLTNTHEAMPVAADVRDSIAGALRGGAVDGVTRAATKSVDGFSDDVHVRFASLYLDGLTIRPQ